MNYHKVIKVFQKAVNALETNLDVSFGFNKSIWN